MAGMPLGTPHDFRMRGAAFLDGPDSVDYWRRVGMKVPFRMSPGTDGSHRFTSLNLCEPGLLCHTGGRIAKLSRPISVQSQAGQG
jgi:hypothetical protein